MPCNQCKHFEPVGRIAAGSKTDGGFCKAHPPHPVITPQGVGYTFSPVSATEECGEFKPRAVQETGQDSGQETHQDAGQGAMATYTVQSGDSLSKIARDVLGNMSLWPQLAAANGISAPYTIYPGQVLQLPGRC